MSNRKFRRDRPWRPGDLDWSPRTLNYDGKRVQLTLGLKLPRDQFRTSADLDKIAPADDTKAADEQREPPAKLASLIAIFKLALGEAVKDVRSSERLTDSAVCLVAEEGDIDMHLERLLKQHRQLDNAAKRILELNPRHRLIERLAASVGDSGASDQLSEFAWLLLDQARIVEGEQLPDPPAFARRLANLLERGLPAAA